jgi:hypothetical protein
VDRARAGSIPSPDAKLYQAALYLYPPSFRREFGLEMMRDFEEARQEVCAGGPPRGLWALRATMSRDLARSVVLQWIRTGLPMIALLSMTATLGAFAGLARLWNGASIDIPETSNSDLLGLELLAAVVLLIIVATIVFTSWFARERARLLPRRRR